MHFRLAHAQAQWNSLCTLKTTTSTTKIFSSCSGCGSKSRNPTSMRDMAVLHRHSSSERTPPIFTRHVLTVMIMKTFPTLE
ncbi:hypothetical protein R3I93_009588 [Phoxinus phoxinus]|uniref:Uncharacterized protein n=1 Tax=Phoxinus phoxinus TaxID=58324 RepID=A0AAN9H5I0_9TELE